MCSGFSAVANQIVALVGSEMSLMTLSMIATQCRLIEAMIRPFGSSPFRRCTLHPCPISIVGVHSNMMTARYALKFDLREGCPDALKDDPRGIRELVAALFADGNADEGLGSDDDR